MTGATSGATNVLSMRRIVSVCVRECSIVKLYSTVEAGECYEVQVDWVAEYKEQNSINRRDEFYSQVHVYLMLANKCDDEKVHYVRSSFSS